MTHYSTCTGCAVDRGTCPKRAAVRNSLSGLNVTAIKFKCSDRRDLFQPGQRVEALIRLRSDGGDEWDREDWAEFHAGTVIKQNGARVCVEIDEAGREIMVNKHGFGKFSLANVRALDEPPRALCLACMSSGPAFLSCNFQPALPENGFQSFNSHGCAKSHTSPQRNPNDPPHPPIHQPW